MTYADQWHALSARIHGLMRAAQLHAQYLGVRSSDTYARGKRLREQCESVLSALLTFRDCFRTSLPPAARISIDEFETRTGTLIRDTTGTPDSLQERVWAALVLLGAFETEMSFFLSDVQEPIRTRSERAFSHLQRSIVADPGFREKWQTAYNEGEVACEKLGAVHLLLHGIFAFKIDAAGARTDLVFQEPAKISLASSGMLTALCSLNGKKHSGKTTRKSDLRRPARRRGDTCEGRLRGVS